jgi:hypothetical protein
VGGLWVLVPGFKSVSGKYRIPASIIVERERLSCLFVFKGNGEARLLLFLCPVVPLTPVFYNRSRVSLMGE